MWHDMTPRQFGETENACEFLSPGGIAPKVIMPWPIEDIAKERVCNVYTEVTLTLLRPTTECLAMPGIESCFWNSRNSKVFEYRLTGWYLFVSYHDISWGVIKITKYFMKFPKTSWKFLWLREIFEDFMRFPLGFHEVSLDFKRFHESFHSTIHSHSHSESVRKVLIVMDCGFTIVINMSCDVMMSSRFSGRHGTSGVVTVDRKLQASSHRAQGRSSVVLKKRFWRSLTTVKTYRNNEIKCMGNSKYTSRARKWHVKFSSTSTAHQNRNLSCAHSPCSFFQNTCHLEHIPNSHWTTPKTTPKDPTAETSNSLTAPKLFPGMQPWPKTTPKTAPRSNCVTNRLPHSNQRPEPKQHQKTQL